MACADSIGDRGPAPRSRERLTATVGGHNGDKQVALDRPRGHGDVDRASVAVSHSYREGLNRGGRRVRVLNPAPADKQPRENQNRD